MTTSVPVLHLTPKSDKIEENMIKNSPQLFKPLPIKIRNNENNLNFPIPIITNDANIPIIYSKLPYGSIPNINFSSPQLNNVLLYEKTKSRKILDGKKSCCSCIKTKCIKKYCECFANNKCCTNCICIDCKNKEIYTNIQNKDSTPNKEIVFCTCAKSGCNKKYCECYKEGLKCNIKCRCVKCLNCDENENSDKANDNDKNLSLDETRYESGKKSTIGESCEFNIEKISVLIGKTQTYINIEKLCKEDFELLCKKRKTSF